jgi:predicted nucleic acid-binding protein
VILFDTGVLVGAARVDDDDHLACAQLLRSIPAGERLVPATVIAETAYLLQTKGNPGQRTTTGADTGSAVSSATRSARRLRTARWLM